MTPSHFWVAVGEDIIFYQISKNGKLLTGYGDFPYEGRYGDVREPVFSNIHHLGEKYRVVAIEYSVFAGRAARRLSIILALKPEDPRYFGNKKNLN